MFDAVTAGELEYFTPVASMPGFPKALARTLHELRLAGIGPDRLGGSDAATGDIGRLLARVEAELARVGVDDRAALFRRAAAAVRDGRVRWASLPIVLLDVPLDSQSDAGFVEALAGRAPDVLATVPDGDVVTEAVLAGLGAEFERRPDDAREATDLFHLRRHVFLSEPPPARDRAGDVRLFSAPGEGREAVEIVRRILDEAEAGVPFDEMAVFLRTPQHYLGLLEHACARAGVPAYFDRGIRRPDPAGRAFIALLSCAVEGLSARRFDEYLSLGQVPRVGSRQSAQSVSRVQSLRVTRLFACRANRRRRSSRSRPRTSRAIRSRFAIQTTRRSSPGCCARRGSGRNSSSSRRSSADAPAQTEGSGGGGASTASPPTIVSASTR